MSTVSSTNSVSSSTAATTGQTNDLRDLNMDQFLQLLISELQNQDPLSPMENTELVQQISQIREISATDQLSETLQSVLDGQNLSTASGLIGERISALSDEGQNVEGVVQRVSLERDGQRDSAKQLRVHIGDQKIRLDNIRDIVAEE